ncbi:MAG: HypC/HybG/HupF family hydrogenase formation chaperone [Anaerolineales bacterium]|nr:HypC/HybG/HupF family hydrogenase formation chaperone [Anaerolineales bacterium]
MCLGVPGKIIEIYPKDNMRMCKIDFGGTTREACLDFIPEAKVGDYTIIHVGFAISLLSEEEAAETLALLQEIADIEEELGPDPSQKV